MEYLTLSNGIPMPLVGFGTFMLGGEPCINAVSTAIQSGYRLIDTAEAYGNEKEVGEGIKQSGIDRGALFLVTKVNFKSYDNTRQTVENSLRLLKTDYLDLVLLHWPFADYYTAWRELETLHAESKIRSIGVSNFEPDRLVDLIAYNKVKPAVNQIETHLYCQRQTEHQWENKYADVAAMLERCHLLAEAGYRPYYLYRQKNTLQNLENVGWCKPGHEGYYNIYIMEEVQTILSAGAGGSTKLVADGGKRMQRIFNFKYPNEYIQRFAEVLERKKGVADFYDHDLGPETVG